MKRKILLGVTGSVAAYKAAELVRLFVKNGDEVKVVMTKAATEFVTPLTFRTLSRNPVAVEEFAPPQSWVPEHIALAEWADIALVAPATANTLAKMRCGIADNLLTSVLLATKARIFIAPAMNTGMLEAAATRENIAVLKERGVSVIEPGEGELACGASGKGRFPGAETIFGAVK
ncbi:MAG: hypothetical protein K6F50_00035 [Kiritimatiellae bacterium]|nr:hypothetical protein [Kiritimatiellia bacterium]